MNDSIPLLRLEPVNPMEYFPEANIEPSKSGYTHAEALRTHGARAAAPAPASSARRSVEWQGMAGPVARLRLARSVEAAAAATVMRADFLLHALPTPLTLTSET